MQAVRGAGDQPSGRGPVDFHFGNAKNHVQHAARVEAQQRLIEFGEPLPVEPTEALLTVLQLSGGHLTGYAAN